MSAGFDPSDRDERVEVAGDGAWPRATGALRWFLDQFLADRDRWILWLPVAMAVGIAVYFALSFEPWEGLGPSAVAAAAIAVIALRKYPGPRLSVWFLVAIALGFSAASWRAHWVGAPVLTRQIGPVTVEGRIFLIVPKENGRAITLDRLQIGRPGGTRSEDLSPEATPAKIRLTLRNPKSPPPDQAIPAAATPLIGTDLGPGADLRPGDRVRMLAILMPPMEPAMPGAYDFARSAWFQRLGAVGLVLGQPVKLAQPAQDLDWLDRYRLWLNGVRQDLAARIYRALPGDSGAVAAALMTGERGAIPQSLEDAYRDSGLTHLLSISGLHLTLVAGLIFFLVRGGLALSEWVALRWPLKKLAAAVAIVGAFAYLQISGGAVATQRSFVMAALVLLAVLLDRQALSMRSVCWAAAAILLVAPESLLEAGFMMSFAAVVALIAAYESAQGRISAWRADAGAIRRGALYLGLTAATTLVATAATLPFVAYHFNRFVDFGVISNLIAVPLTSVWVMPWAVVAFLLMLFEGESLALSPMGWGVAVINWLARTVAAWPGAVSMTPVMPGWGLIAASLGGVWFCLWRQRWRWFGVAALAAGLLSPLATVPPDILIDPTGRVAIRAEDGRLVFAEKRKARGIVAETWNRRMAQTTAVVGSADPDLDLHCDTHGCIYRARGLIVALPKGPEALADDCPGADLVLAAFSVRRNCPDALLVVDRQWLKRGGAHAIWLGSGTRTESIRVEDVASQRGQRLWVTSGRPKPKLIEAENSQKPALGPVRDASVQYFRSNPTSRP